MQRRRGLWQKFLCTIAIWGILAIPLSDFVWGPEFHSSITGNISYKVTFGVGLGALVSIYGIWVVFFFNEFPRE